MLVDGFGLGEAEAKRLTKGKSREQVAAIIEHINAKDAAGKVESRAAYVRHCLKNGCDVNEVFGASAAEREWEQMPKPAPAELLSTFGITDYRKEVESQLLALGVTKGSAAYKELLGNPHVTPTSIAICEAEEAVQKKRDGLARKGIGLLIQRLRGIAGPTKILKPEVAAWLVNNNYLLKLCGCVAIKAGWNRDEVTLWDVERQKLMLRVPASELLLERMDWMPLGSRVEEAPAPQFTGREDR
jgi:hypothetical protein